MLGLIALWSHLLAAALYGALAIFQLRRWNGDPLGRPLVSAFAVVAVWSIFLSMLDPHNALTQHAESARNLVFLAFMYGILQEAGDGGGQRAVKAVFAAVAGVVGLQIVIGGIISQYDAVPNVQEALSSTSQLIGLTIAAGALILVHNLYGQAAPASRNALKYPMVALAAMWAYDLHLYTVAYFTQGLAADLFAMRGVVLAMLVPLFALGLRGEAVKIQISRAATFQSLSVIVILTYLIAMMSASRAMEVVGGNWGRVAQIGIILVMTLAALVLLPSAKARAWLRVLVAKHVFEHRYDYRQEWLRFTDTIGGSEGEGSPSLEERVIQALCDIGGAPAGLLLLADGQYRLAPAARWLSDASLPASGDGAEALMHFVEGEAHIIDFDDIRGGRLVAGGRKLPAPTWLTDLERAWAGIPLIHAGKLVGIVILEHPPFRRPLDWEDFDLFRAAGIQAASYIAEARSQQALADSRRFDEFNRRFAFILHDVKNLVSQLSLVARNAERHADNPEFQADMIATLQSSVKKLNDLLARLSHGAARDPDSPRFVRIADLVEGVAAAKSRTHGLRVSGEDGLVARVDAAGLEQALAHLVQNAIDASGPDDPVELRYLESGGDVVIEIVDHGPGMSEDFVRTRLFQPFVSTKESGFGIGAYEARALVAAMGGRLEVESEVGKGTRFTMILPGAEMHLGPRALTSNRERMRA